MRGKPGVIGTIACCVLALTQAPGCLRSRTADQASDRANRDGQQPPAAVADAPVGGTEISEVNEPKSTSDPRILYWPRLKPEPLSDEQVRRISQAVEDIGQGRDLWFVLVLRNKENCETVHVYCVPDMQSRRVRRGMAFENIWGRGHFLSACTFSYAQVSASDDPFEGHPVPPRDFALLPFALPDDFTDEELIEVVDFIRSPSARSPRVPKGDDGETFRYFLFPVDPNDPVYRIRRHGEAVTIEMGLVEGPLSGYLNVFTCQKVDGVWTIGDRAGYLF
jgi:hypothetical protein